MNKQETQLLYALYYHREIVGEEISYSAAELNWAKNAAIPEGKKWLKDNKLQVLHNNTEDRCASKGAISAVAERPLTYLQSKGYITYIKDGSLCRIAVTGLGADVARELDTFLGRLNLIYKRHKDGMLWFIATILTSIVTTLVTKWIAMHAHIIG